MPLQDWTWTEIEALRDRIAREAFPSVQEAAQAFASDLARSSPTIVLARVFVALPFSKLPVDEARLCVGGVNGQPLGPGVSVLSLLGTAGREPAWNDRTRSRGHRAIPLLGAAHVQAIPMIAKLLADLELDLAPLDEGKPIVTRRLLGGLNGAFFVEDARTARDATDRPIIAPDFVETYGVRTVFGMGGAYVDGTLAVAIVFTTETLSRLAVDRFPSLIGNFKMATNNQLLARCLYATRANPQP